MARENKSLENLQVMLRGTFTKEHLFLEHKAGTSDSFSRLLEDYGVNKNILPSLISVGIQHGILESHGSRSSLTVIPQKTIADFDPALIAETTWKHFSDRIKSSAYPHGEKKDLIPFRPEHVHGSPNDDPGKLTTRRIKVRQYTVPSLNDTRYFLKDGVIYKAKVTGVMYDEDNQIEVVLKTNDSSDRVKAWSSFETVDLLLKSLSQNIQV